jgi:hypothetical protein
VIVEPYATPWDHAFVPFPRHTDMADALAHGLNPAWDWWAVCFEVLPGGKVDAYNPAGMRACKAYKECHET